jgi:hypothetical protein
MLPEVETTTCRHERSTEGDEGFDMRLNPHDYARIAACLDETFLCP